MILNGAGGVTDAAGAVLPSRASNAGGSPFGVELFVAVVIMGGVIPAGGELLAPCCCSCGYAVVIAIDDRRGSTDDVRSCGTK